jgi:hypothetical protein
MSAQKTPISIHAVLNLTKMNDGTVLPILKGTLKGLTANATLFNKPPVDLATYSAAIDAFETSIPPALDGSKTAVEQKKKLRIAVLNMYSQLAHYVEANCNNDMSTFLLSGFQAKQPATKTQPPPASETIRKIDRGANSGQVKVKLLRNKGARSYELRWAPVPPGGAPISWINQPITLVKTATTVNGLTPGTMYAFGVRALLKTGYTDWSDSVTMICA